MKKLSCYIGLLMAMFWLAACKSDTPLEPETTVGDGEQVLEITVDGDFYAGSRSTAASAGYKLVSSQAIQHIEHLYAYIFKGSGTDATCVYVTEIPWEQNSQQGPASLTYRLKEANLPQYGKSEMQVLVVAVDNNTDTYYFPYDGVANHADATETGTPNPIIGKQLKDVKLQLADAVAGVNMPEETAAEKAFRMANTEVFSGLTKFIANEQIIRVDLQRCVAGVLCYVTDIPYYVGGGTEEENQINSIELQLDQNLNLNTTYAGFYDDTKFGSMPHTDTKVIASVNILEYIYGKVGTGGTLDVQPGDASVDKSQMRLYVPALDNGSVKTKENSILFGAYLLPIEVTQTDNSGTHATLKLVLKNNDGSRETKFAVKNTVTSVPGKPNEDGTPGTSIPEPAYNYSLKANRLYSIGSKPLVVNTDADHPASLKGKEIVLSIIPWSGDDFEDDVNFPVYSLKSHFIADWGDNYIFNCMNTTYEIELKLSESDANSTDALSLNTIENPDSWLFFRLLNDDGTPYGDGSWKSNFEIPSELKTKPSIRIQLLLNDYVKNNPIMEGTEPIEEKLQKLREDYRPGHIKLMKGTIIIADRSVKQYNAITAGGIGYSRVDYGDKMIENGGVKGNIVKKFWGYFTYGPILIFGHQDSNDDGEQNMKDAISKNSDPFSGSIFDYARYDALEYNGTNNIMNNRLWYVPAKNELNTFFNNVVKPISDYYNVLDERFIPLVNILKNNSYWSSSTASNNLTRNSYINKISGNEVQQKGVDRNNTYLVRQARKFN